MQAGRGVWKRAVALVIACCALWPAAAGAQGHGEDGLSAFRSNEELRRFLRRRAPKPSYFGGSDGSDGVESVIVTGSRAPAAGGVRERARISFAPQPARR